MTTEALDQSQSEAYASPATGGMTDLGIYKEIGSARLTNDLYAGAAETLPELRGTRRLKLYHEMRENSTTVGAMMMAIKMIMRSLDWMPSLPEGAEEDDAEALAAQQFLKECMDDMSTPWSEVIDDSMDAVWAGFAAPEIVYKQRLGDQISEDTPTSDYDDGRIGWRKIAYRDPMGVVRWDIDEHGGIRGYYHQVEGQPEVYIPIEKVILFRASRKGNHPEGYSWLRNAVVAYMYQKKIQWLEAVGLERAGMGLPIVQLPYGANTSSGSQDITRARNLVQGIRRDTMAGVVLPPSLGPEPHQQWQLRLETATATGVDSPTDVVIRRYALEIASSVLAHFVILVMQTRGSYSLSVDQRDLWHLAMSGLANTWAELMNRFMVKPLFRLNKASFPDPTKWPRIVPSDVATHDLEKVQMFLSSMLTAGALNLNEDDRDRIRALINFPPETKEQKEQAREDEERMEQMRDMALASPQQESGPDNEGEGQSSSQAGPPPPNERSRGSRRMSERELSPLEMRVGKPIGAWTSDDAWLAAILAGEEGR